MNKKGINGAYRGVYNQYPWGVYNLIQSLLLAAIMAVVGLYAMDCEAPGCAVVAAIMGVGVALCLRSGAEAGVGWILWQRNGQVTITDTGVVFRTVGRHEVVILWDNITAVRWVRRSPYYRLRNADRYDVFQYTLAVSFVDDRGGVHKRDIMQCFANTPHANCVLVRDVMVRRALLDEKNGAVSPAKTWRLKIARVLSGLPEERLWLRPDDSFHATGGKRDE